MLSLRKISANGDPDSAVQLQSPSEFSTLNFKANPELLSSAGKPLERGEADRLDGDDDELLGDEDI